MSQSCNAGRETDHKVLNLYREQTAAYQNAKEAVKEELGDDVTEGEVVKELATAYTDHNGLSEPTTICELVTETAAENGDATYSLEQLQAMDNNTLRNMAANVETDAISGRSTRYEITAYFCCPEAVEVTNEFPEA